MNYISLKTNVDVVKKDGVAPVKWKSNRTSSKYTVLLRPKSNTTQVCTSRPLKKYILYSMIMGSVNEIRHVDLSRDIRRHKRTNLMSDDVY